ncbi:AAA family ATPase [Roseomonas sp. NAR14]|uniref:AAA family ATPase n=1 Tax=Roseomonas acroporae TaxID=2937791 RepID=A0A9X1Y4W2_9PROT|nr:AAA family ATPase [Roseomonas acroporae]MCK8783338.1 AAA family ATPase [Roseomonas acroporae]
MRLTALTLRRYGNFDTAEIALDPAPGRVNLLVAPNGAGKSVLRSAFGDLLFGIGAQTPMGFRHGYQGMRLDAAGIDANGAPFRFGRRKGQGNTLLDAAGDPGDPAMLAGLLGTADRNLLERLFALDTEALRRGGDELLRSGGALAEALLAAAGGMREAQSVREALNAERDRLAPARKSAQRPFYAALERWTGSRRAKREAVLRPETWQGWEAELDTARAARAEANRAATAAAETIRRLERLRRVRPLLARRDDAADWLAAHPDAPVLPEGFAAQVPETRAALRQAEAALDAARATLAGLAAETAGERPDHALLAEAGPVAALTAQSGAATRARDELPAARAALRDRHAELADRLRQLGRDLPPERAAEAVPPRAPLARLRRLLAERAGNAGTLARGPARLAAIAQRVADAQAALAALPPALDTAGLQALLDEITAGGRPAELHAAARRTAAEAAAALDAALAALPAPLRDPAALAALSPPDDATLASLAAARDRARTARDAIEDGAARAAEALEAAESRLATLRAAGPLPDAAALAAARARRDSGWHLIYRRAFAGTPDVAAEAEFAGDGTPLPLAYAGAVAAADALADQRNAESERLAAAAEQERIADAQRAALEALGAAREAAGRDLAAAEAAWAGTLAPLALPPEAGPAEVERRLAARGRALAAWREQRAKDAALAELDARQEAAAARLAAFAPPGEDRPGDGRPGGMPAVALLLQARLDRATESLRAARLADATRGQFQAALDAARAERAEAEAERQAAEARQEGWQSEWAAALAALGRPADEHPDDTSALLDLLDGIGPLAREAAAGAARVAAAEAELAGFDAAAEALRARVAPDLEAGDPFALARALDQRLRAAQAVAKRRELLERQREAAATARREAEAAAARAARDWQAVLDALGAEEATLTARLALAEERARRQAALAGAETALFEAGDGLSLAALRAEADAQPAEATEAALEEARAAQAAQGEAAQEAAAAATRVEARMQHAAGEDTALAAAASEEAAASSLGTTLDDALLMQAASSLLEAALAELGESANDAVMRRIGDAVATLTEGAYPGVAARQEQRGPARLVLRAASGEEAEVGQLSEGTRDQLFLALRLVAIEDHVAGGFPLPFLGDDILQTFDDRRAAAAFRALLGLSHSVQVVLLTHHPHLAEVARAALPAGALWTQELGVRELAPA